MEEVASRHGFLKILLLLTVVFVMDVQCDPNLYERTLVVQFNMYDYVNPSGKSLRGQYCDGPHCDLQFFLYFSGSQRGDHGNHASLGTVQYNAGQKHKFGTHGTQVPANHSLEFRIQSNWANGFKIELDVRDRDDAGRLVEYDNFELTFQEPKQAFNIILKSDSQLRNHPSLLRVDYNVTTRCDRSVFYGPLCQVYCRTENGDNGHYTCDAEGNKHCMHGWVDLPNDCKEPNLCERGGHCLNNGHCVVKKNLHYTFVCNCSLYYTGERCEISDSACSESTAANCLNGGQCVIKNGDINCTCPNFFYGKFCQVYCKMENSDDGHYICNTDGQKICMSGWLDPSDDCKRLDECSRGYCQNNGSCSALPNKKYLCTCPKYYTGKHCETRGGRDNRDRHLHQWLRLSSSGIQLLPGTAAVFLGVAAVATASCLGL